MTSSSLNKHNYSTIYVSMFNVYNLPKHAGGAFLTTFVSVMTLVEMSVEVREAHPYRDVTRLLIWVCKAVYLARYYEHSLSKCRLPHASPVSGRTQQIAHFCGIESDY